MFPTTHTGRTVHPNDDIYYHSTKILGPSMWHFSGDGLMVFDPEGNILKSTPKEQQCAVYETFDRRSNQNITVDECRFFVLASDGHRYVWAGARSDTGDRVEVFDIDTAEFVGFVNTCRVPMDLSYHPGRQEMLVHCHDSLLDVLSGPTLGSNFSKIDLEYTTDGPAGRVLTHSTLGAMAYAVAGSHPFLNQIDLSSRQVIAAHELPLASGGRTLAYSQVNHHIYIRPRVCCTCGPGGDIADCGRSTPGPVDISTGPSQGINVTGICGSSCQGSAADTIGVYEFDTVHNQILGAINIDPVHGYGAEAVTSPNGQHVLFFGSDGGKAVRVLKPGQTGTLSTVLADISVDFQGGKPGTQVISDFCFVTDDTRNILVLGASSDNHIVLVDMNDDNFRMHKLALTNAAESTGGNDRHIEWVVGTNHIWVTGNEAQELYIVELPSANINDAKVKKTMRGVPAGDIMVVENYERRATMEVLQVEMGIQLDEIDNTISALELEDKNANGNIDISINDDDDNEDKALKIAIVAIVLGALAFIVSILSVVSLYKVQSVSSAVPPNENAKKDSSTEDNNEDIETKTLGSKMVS